MTAQAYPLHYFRCVTDAGEEYPGELMETLRPWFVEQDLSLGRDTLTPTYGETEIVLGRSKVSTIPNVYRYLWF